MSTETTTETATEVESPAEAEALKQPKSFTKILKDSKKNEMQFQAYAKASGKVSAYVVHRVVKVGENGKLVTDYTKRGASQEFNSLEEARASLQKGIELAIKAGWTEGAPGGLGGVGGVKARPDAFSLANLPAPAPGGAPAKSRK